MKIIPQFKVKDLPFYDTIKQISNEERERIGLIESTGGINEYRRAFILGQGDNTKAKTWNKKKHWHECCKSKVVWRHKSNCKNCLRNAPDDYSDLKDL